MKTFDEALDAIKTILRTHSAAIARMDKLVINRDLNGRVRLLADSEKTPDELKNILDTVAGDMTIALGARIPDNDKVLYESPLEAVIKDIPCFALEGFPNVIVADRLMGETDWGNIVPVRSDSYRVVFYSIKGGVGRSTALAAAAWTLAEEGKRVLVMDMDLESPGISSSLLSPDKAPQYGIVDWLVEDLLDNGDAVSPGIFSVSDLSRNGEILVVPAHGKEPGEYIAKMGRAWMPKHAGETPEPWQNRLNRLLTALEKERRPDVVLIDSRAGIDEISSACITGLGAEAVLLFSIDSNQTWAGYNILFNYWLKTGAYKDIRDRLQVVGALVPETATQNEYIDSLCEHSWNLFTEKLYEEIPASGADTDIFNFDKGDIEAPHYPRIIRWNRGFEALPNLYQPLGQQLAKEQIRSTFGNLIDFVERFAKNG